MRETNVILAAIILFASVQAIGLYVGSQYSAAIATGAAKPIVENPQDATNSFFLFAYILAVTAVLLVLIRLKKKMIRAVEAFAVFFSSWIVFDFTIPYAVGDFFSIGFFLALLLTLWKMLRPTILSQNVALVFAVSGAGAVIGASLGVLPVIIFMLVLSLYDFLSVFWTKHMVYLTRAITETPTAFTAAIPATFAKPRPVGQQKTAKKEHVFQLGGGDLAIPLVFSVSVLNQFGLASALFAAAGALAAMTALFTNVLKKPGHALPALPPICAGAVAGFALSLLARSLLAA